MTWVHDLVEGLRRSTDPCVRYKLLVRVLDAPLDSTEAKREAIEAKRSQRVQALLSERGADGRIPRKPYAKWTGAHWVLASLADLCYPAGDQSLRPLVEQCLEWLFSPEHLSKIRAIDGRTRRCASQEGNALYYATRLGIQDPRLECLADSLVAWQWPDGGWNCDTNPKATNSSFMETLIPLRGLAAHADATATSVSRAATRRAAEVFLKRRLFKAQKDGRVIHEDFIKLHYPCYWHYDILFGLKTLAEAGLINDPRCNDALDLLESKRLTGGYPNEKVFHQVSRRDKSGFELVQWGPAGRTRGNEYVSLDALFVLKSAGRIAL